MLSIQLLYIRINQNLTRTNLLLVRTFCTGHLKKDPCKAPAKNMGVPGGGGGGRRGRQPPQFVGQTKPVGQYSLHSRAILAYYKNKWDNFVGNSVNFVGNMLSNRNFS